MRRNMRKFSLGGFFFEGILMVVNLKKIEIGDMDKIEELQDQINQMTLQVFLTPQVNE